MTDCELIKAASETMKKAYAPYSGFNVGAALITDNGALFTGCNIENASFGGTVCAERCAIFDAVKNGHRIIKKIAVCGGKNGQISDFCPPCGICRQVLSEFADADTEIILYDGQKYKTYKIDEMLPERFVKDNLDK